MRLTIEMHDPEGTILSELASKAVPQSSIAITYAFLIAQEENTADWPKINQAIRERWRGRAALERIKKQAWKHVDDWHRRRQPAQDIAFKREG
jgi:hypothetical protein